MLFLRNRVRIVAKRKFEMNLIECLRQMRRRSGLIPFGENIGCLPSSIPFGEKFCCLAVERAPALATGTDAVGKFLRYGTGHDGIEVEHSDDLPVSKQHIRQLRVTVDDRDVIGRGDVLLQRGSFFTGTFGAISPPGKKRPDPFRKLRFH